MPSSVTRTILGLAATGLMAGSLMLASAPTAGAQVRPGSPPSTVPRVPPGQGIFGYRVDIANCTIRQGQCVAASVTGVVTSTNGTIGTPAAMLVTKAWFTMKRGVVPAVQPIGWPGGPGGPTVPISPVKGPGPVTASSTVRWADPRVPVSFGIPANAAQVCFEGEIVVNGVRRAHKMDCKNV
jgi:hypothetical protein